MGTLREVDVKKTYFKSICASEAPKDYNRQNLKFKQQCDYSTINRARKKKKKTIPGSWNQVPRCADIII